MNWPDLIAYIIYIVVTTVMIIVVVNLAVKNKKQASMIIQLGIDRAEVLAKLGDLSMKVQNGDIEKTDGFIKFITESRDWAFAYIEDVQEAIKQYEDAIDGIPVSREITVDRAKQINDAFEKLVSFLPKDN